MSTKLIIFSSLMIAISVGIIYLQSCQTWKNDKEEIIAQDAIDEPIDYYDDD